jgi:hypothetical protein
MPPGGFRLAVINARRMGPALALREQMGRDFGLQHYEQRPRAAPAA